MEFFQPLAFIERQCGVCLWKRQQRGSTMCGHPAAISTSVLAVPYRTYPINFAGNMHQPFILTKHVSSPDFPANYLVEVYHCTAFVPANSEESNP